MKQLALIIFSLLTINLTVEAQPKTTSGYQTLARVHPLHLLVNSMGIDLEFKGGQNWTLGPSIAFWNDDSDNQTFESRASFIGARGTYTFNHEAFTTGWYLSPFIGYTSVQVEKTDELMTEGKGSSGGFMLGSYGGYQYFWNQFSTNVGIGYAFTGTDDVEVMYAASGRSEEVDAGTVGGFVWEASFGYSF